MSSPNLDRAHLLLEQRRGKDAEEYARLAIAEDIDNPSGYNALCSALYQQDRYKEALEPAKTALGLNPNSHHTLYQLAYIHYSLQNWKESEAAALEALTMYPEDSDTLGLLSYLSARKAKWEQSLDFAEQGLRFNSDHVTCTNARANALTKLKRSDHAQASLDYALQRDPDNPLTHYQKGRVLLETGEYDKAAEHFCEALRLEPDFAEAKDGLVEALKGKHLIYSIFLKYTFFMSRLEPKVQWGIVLGGYFGQRILASFLANSGYPQWSTAVWITYLSIVYFTWTASSLFNLLLFVHPQGRHALSGKQKTVSASVGSAILCAVATLVLYLFSNYDALYTSIFAFAFLTIPLSTITRFTDQKRLKIVVGISITQFFLSAGSVVFIFLGRDDIGSILAIASIFISLAYSWLASFIIK